MCRKDKPITYFMDKITIVQELITEVDKMQQQLVAIRQRLALLEVSMQADVATLQASELRVKQLEMMLANQKSQVESQCKVSAEGKRSLNYAEPQPDFMSRANKVEGQKSQVEGQRSQVESRSKEGALLNAEMDNQLENTIDQPKNPEIDESSQRLNASTPQQQNTESPEQHEINSPNCRRADECEVRISTESPSRDARIITDLRKAIGLNDRFRFKNDLFANNESLLFDTIDVLNGMHSLSEADAYIKAHFDWKADDATVVYFYEILERKFFRP